MTQCSKQPANLEAPVAKKIAKELTAHDHTRIDNYFWMNQRDNDEVIAHLNDENDYTDKMMKHTEKLQKKLYKVVDNVFERWQRFVVGEAEPSTTDVIADTEARKPDFRSMALSMAIERVAKATLMRGIWP